MVPTRPIPGMQRLTSEPYAVTAARFATRCAACGGALKKLAPAYFYRNRDVYSHMACRLLDVDDFEHGFFFRCRGEPYAVKARCLRCDDPIFAGAWVFASGDIWYHFDCAQPLVMGSYDADAELHGGYFNLPQRSPGRVA